MSLSRIGASGSQPPARNANPLQFNQSFQKPLQGKTSAKWYYSTSKSKPEPGRQETYLLLVVCYSVPDPARVTLPSLKSSVLDFRSDECT